jgi:hypothetical protein
MNQQQKRSELLFGLQGLKNRTEVFVDRADLVAAGLPLPSDAKRFVGFRVEELDRLITEANLADQRAADESEAIQNQLAE